MALADVCKTTRQQGANAQACKSKCNCTASPQAVEQVVTKETLCLLHVCDIPAAAIQWQAAAWGVT